MMIERSEAGGSTRPAGRQVCAFPLWTIPTNPVHGTALWRPIPTLCPHRCNEVGGCWMISELKPCQCNGVFERFPRVRRAAARARVRFI